MSYSLEKMVSRAFPKRSIHSIHVSERRRRRCSSQETAFNAAEAVASLKLQLQEARNEVEEVAAAGGGRYQRARRQLEDMYSGKIAALQDEVAAAKQARVQTRAAIIQSPKP